MDGSSNGLGKLIPKALVTKRRRNRASSITDTASSLEDSASRSRSISSQQGTIESDQDATSNRDDDGHRDNKNVDAVNGRESAEDSDPE
jgi:hypothetical protein